MLYRNDICISHIIQIYSKNIKNTFLEYLWMIHFLNSFTGFSLETPKKKCAVKPLFRPKPNFFFFNR